MSTLEEHPKFVCYFQERKIIIRNGGSGGQLEIGRILSDSEISSQTVHVRYTGRSPGVPPRNAFHLDGIIGIVWLHLGPYIILLNGSRRVCLLPSLPNTNGCAERGPCIRSISSVLILPILSPNSQPRLSPELIQENTLLINRLKGLLVSPLSKHRFYFTLNSSYDITSSYQRQYSATKGETKKRPGWENRNHNFWWNSHLVSDFQKESCFSRWIIPIINGHVVSSGTLPAPSASKYDAETVSVSLIARRSRYQQGMRFFKRGLDNDGKAANEVECEQIVALASRSPRKPDYVSSFVQLRGSVPTYWSQLPTTCAVPKCHIKSGQDAYESFQKHFKDICERYGNVYCINLLADGKDNTAKSRAKKDQVKLGQVYASFVNRMFGSEGLSQFVWFDFHRECGKPGKYENLGKLAVKTQDWIRNSGLFSYKLCDGNSDSSNQIGTLQSGVLRTNCLDTLDRTNAVQTLFGMIALVDQLGIDVHSNKPWVATLSANGPLHEYLGGNLEQAFRYLWMTNGDRQSMCYAGSPALKRLLVLSGSVSLKGKIADKFVSFKRWVANNFQQGAEQDAIDLMLGHYISARSSRLLSNQGNVRRAQLTSLIIIGPIYWIFLAFVFARYPQSIMAVCFWTTMSWLISVALLLFLLLQGKLGRQVEFLVQMPGTVL